jgi:hypothetical protein
MQIITSRATPSQGTSATIKVMQTIPHAYPRLSEQPSNWCSLSGLLYVESYLALISLRPRKMSQRLVRAKPSALDLRQRPSGVLNAANKNPALFGAAAMGQSWRGCQGHGRARMPVPLQRHSSCSGQWRAALRRVCPMTRTTPNTSTCPWLGPNNALARLRVGTHRRGARAGPPGGTGSGCCGPGPRPGLRNLVDPSVPLCVGPAPICPV